MQQVWVPIPISWAAELAKALAAPEEPGWESFFKYGLATVGLLSTICIFLYNSRISKKLYTVDLFKLWIAQGRRARESFMLLWPRLYDPPVGGFDDGEPREISKDEARWLYELSPELSSRLSNECNLAKIPERSLIEVKQDFDDFLNLMTLFCHAYLIGAVNRRDFLSIFHVTYPLWHGRLKPYIDVAREPGEGPGFWSDVDDLVEACRAYGNSRQVIQDWWPYWPIKGRAARCVFRIARTFRQRNRPAKV